MFYSQCPLSSKGPLGVVWVAAYFFNKLKKSQVNETDICSSVDKILQDGLDVVTYRILAYLLLGIVRIYSRKVEYLFHDCNDGLIEIKKFLANAKDDGHIETLCMPSCSISLPKRFELDAFDLEINEDVHLDNIVCNESITLKDISWKDEGMSLIPLDTYNLEEFDVCQNTNTSDHDMLCYIPQYKLDVNYAVDAIGTSDLTGLPKHGDKQEGDKMQSEDVKTFCGVENEHADTAIVLSEDHPTIHHSMKSLEIVPYEDTSTGEASMEKLLYSRFSLEPADIQIFCSKSEWSTHEYLPNKDHEDDRQQARCQEVPSLENEMHRDKVIEDIFADQLMEFDSFSGINTVARKDVRGSTNKCRGSDAEKTENVIRNEGENQINNMPELMIEKTLQSKPPHSAGGATSPEFIMIPTPAVMEHARFSRKRKCLVDESLVLSNEALRQSINDASDLISKRRKCPRTLLASWRASWISTLSRIFFEPIIPCRALQFKFPSPENEDISETGKAIPSGNIDVSQSLVNAGSGNTTTAPVTPPQQSTAEPAEGAVIVRFENVAAAPLTPPQQSKFRPVESAATPKVTERSSSSTESLEEYQTLCMKEEDNLTVEELNSCEMGNKESNGRSCKTRIAVRYLHNKFLDMRKQGEEEIMNLQQVLGRGIKKECATLFYEILVLRSKGYVDVKQTNPYGNISVRKLSKWDNIVAADQ